VTAVKNELNRRDFLAGAAVLVGAPLLAAGSDAVAGATRTDAGTTNVIAYVGSYTTAAVLNAHGVGISVYRIDARTGRWRLIQVLAADDGDPAIPPPGADPLPVNPSYLALDHTQTRLYTVHGDATQLSSFAIDERSGELTRLNTVDTGRQNPVYITVDPTNRWVVVANLDPPGSIITLRRQRDGSLGPIAGDITLPGTPGPHKIEQLGCQPHQARFDPTGRWLAVPDRGLDRIFVLRLDTANGALSLNDPGWVSTRELAGPRHIAFNPTAPFAYAIDELRSTVTTYRWDNKRGTLEALQVLPSTPPDMTGDCRAAEIVVAPSGRHLYASNRSGAGVIDPQRPKDTIGVWTVDPDTGLLEPLTWTSTDGYVPRFFTVDAAGTRLYAANQVTDSIVTFAIDARTGRLRPTGTPVDVRSPACIILRETAPHAAG
jgi:6-phosphogluconolactonase